MGTLAWHDAWNDAHTEHWQMPAITHKSAHQWLDAGAVDKNRTCDRYERQLDQVQGQVFGETLLDGVHQVVQRTDAAHPEPATMPRIGHDVRVLEANSATAEQPDESDHNQIKGDDVIQQTRHHQNENSRYQRNQGGEA